MIPAKYASKIGVCEVKVHNTLVKVRVVDDSNVVSLGLSELKSEIGEDSVVGLLVKAQPDSDTSIQMMVLCVKSRCLIIQVCRMPSIPQCLKDFLYNENICFVGPAMETTLDQLRWFIQVVRIESHTGKSLLSRAIGMDLGNLAAKVYMDPTLLTKNWTSTSSVADQIQSIADKVGIALDGDTNDHVTKDSIDLTALAFSHKEIKYLVSDVYASYLITSRMLECL